MRLTIGRRERVISQASSPANSGTTITMPPISATAPRNAVIRRPHAPCSRRAHRPPHPARNPAVRAPTPAQPRGFRRRRGCAPIAAECREVGPAFGRGQRHRDRHAEQRDHGRRHRESRSGTVAPGLWYPFSTWQHVVAPEQSGRPRRARRRTARAGQLVLRPGPTSIVPSFARLVRADHRGVPQEAEPPVAPPGTTAACEVDPQVALVGASLCSSTVPSAVVSVRSRERPPCRPAVAAAPARRTRRTARCTPDPLPVRLNPPAPRSRLGRRGRRSCGVAVLDRLRARQRDRAELYGVLDRQHCATAPLRVPASTASSRNRR